MPPTLTSTDPRTGVRAVTDIDETSEIGVAETVARARAAAPVLAGRDRAWRAELLDSLAAALEERRATLVATASAETGLADARLGGELTRTVFQLRLFADAVREGSFLEAAIDHAAETPMGPGPDVRRMLVPVGPVAVFGSSNFPFAFSVPGGDTASALAAGNPVIAKAHSAHPLTSRAAYDALVAGAERVGAPEGTVGIVYGQRAGSHLVAHPDVAAVGFTGSLGAATRLREVIAERERPIPFYGELQSVNPLIVTDAALRARAPQIATGLAASITGSGGQLCTKPGVAFVPEGEEADAFIDLLVTAVAETPSSVLLNERVLDGFREAERELTTAEGVESLLGDATDSAAGFSVAPRVLRVAASALTPAHTVEAFGPLVLVVTYRDEEQLIEAVGQVPDSLTASLHLEETDVSSAGGLVEQLAAASGRLVFNGYPTGVRVSWAQHHGGPWPATNTLHTSVGVSAVRRFLRPLAWQDAPESLLPEELRDGYRGIPRRVDGVLQGVASA